MHTEVYSEQITKSDNYENLNKYLSKLENYNKCIVKGRILKADDKNLGDKLEEYKVHKRKMQNAQKGKAL